MCATNPVQQMSHLGSHRAQLQVSSEVHAAGMIFRKEPFFYGHDNYDQLVKIAKVRTLRLLQMVLVV